MSTVYFHIGIMKTGTSAIQNFLWQNNDVLIKKGYYYPLMGLPIPNIYRMRNGHFLIYKADQETRMDIWKRGWKKVHQEIENHENIIISDESIWYRQNWPVWDGREFWQCVKEELEKSQCNYKVIVYLRRQDYFVESYWNTAVKGDTRTKLTFKRYIAERKYEFCQLDYYEQIKKMQDVLGKEKVIVRCYEKEQYEGNGNTLISDFLKCVGLDMTDEYQPLGIAANPALTGNYVEIKRLFNQIKDYPPLDNFLRYPVQKACAAANGKFGRKEEKTAYFTQEAREAFMKRYAESNRKLAKEILNREDGILFYAKEQNLPVWQVNRETIYEDIIRVMGEIACAQYMENKKIYEKLENQRKRIEKLEKNQKEYLLRKLYRKIGSVRKDR